MRLDRGFQSKVERILKDNGWIVARFNHCHQILRHLEILRHLDKPNSIPLPYRLNDRGLALSILRNQAGLSVRL